MNTENHTGSTGPSSFALAILRGLQGKPQYEGTVLRATVDRRRVANKVARRSRRINRTTR